MENIHRADSPDFLQKDQSFHGQSLKMPKKGILDGGPKQLRIRAEDEIELDVLGDFNDRDGDPIGIEIAANKPTP